MKRQLGFLLVSLILILLYSNAASAGNTYNFYFDSEDDGVSVPPTRSQEVAKDLYDDGVRVAPPVVIPQIKAKSSTSKSRELDPDKFRGFRLGAAFNTVAMQGGFNSKSDDEQIAYMPGITFSVRLFPIKYFGLFGEATIGGHTVGTSLDITDRSGFTRLFYNFGAELVPLRIDFFGVEDIIELAGEVGFSTLFYASYNVGSSVRNGNIYNTITTQEFTTGLFYGPKVRLNFGNAFSLETMLRIGASQDTYRNAQFLAGATVNF